MSDANLARRAAVQVAFSGIDITKSITPYLLSLTYTDSEENEADDLQIKLQDREDIWLTSWLNQAIEADAEASASRQTSGTYQVNAQSGVNIRSGPGTNYASYGTLPYGAVVTVTGSTGEWSIFTYNEKTAYLYTQYISPTNTNASAMPTVSFGSTGTAVKTLQQHLKTLGYPLPRYGDDGVFGNETREAVLAFQGDNALDQDGICGPLTWAALFDAIRSGSYEDTTQQVGLSISAVIVLQNMSGDGKDQILDCGQFELDSVDASGPPSGISIKATALPYTAQIRQTEKSKAWEAYHLSGIAKEIAQSSGMSCMYLSASDPYYKRVEQYATSDITFLQTLCQTAGLSLKATNNILVLFDQAAYESEDTIRTIQKGDRSYIKYKLSTSEAQKHYTSCKVVCTASDGTFIEGFAQVEDYDVNSKTNQQLVIHAKVTSIAEANALAAKLLRLHNKFQKTASFTMLGDPSLVAGKTVLLEDWGAWSGKYIISKAKHSVGNAYTVQVELRKVLEGY